jgi:hypothetical protein
LVPSSIMRPIGGIMTAQERIVELAEILSLGLMRVRATQSTALSPQSADVGLDSYSTPRMCVPDDQSGDHA